MILKNRKGAVLLTLLTLLFILSSCGPAEDFFYGKWLRTYSGKYNYDTLELNQDMTFVLEGVRLNNKGTFEILENKPGYAKLKMDSISDYFDKTIEITYDNKRLRIKEGNRESLWYDFSSDVSKKAIAAGEQNTRHESRIRNFPHEYMMKLPDLGRTEKEMVHELGQFDTVSRSDEYNMYLYGLEGMDENGVIYSYKFYAKDGKVYKVEALEKNLLD